MSTLSRRRFLVTSGGFAGASLIRARPAAAQSAGGRPRLAIVCSNYIRFMPLATGDVRPQDLDLTWIRADRTEVLRRATGDTAVDGGEASMAQHVMRLDSGDRSFVAVPVFPLRNFTARDVYTRKGTRFSLKSIDGRRIGIYNWAASGAVWYRHLVRWSGQDPSKVRWIVGNADAPGPVTARGPFPANVSVAPEGKSLSDLLLSGEIDAFFAPLPPQRHHGVNGPIVRLIPDFRSVEQKYFAATRCYPPQHVMLVRRDVWQKDPTVGRRLVAACDESDAAFHAAQRLYPYNSPWLIGDIEEAEAVMGADYHAHGLDKNRHAVDVFCQGAFDDGLTKRRLTVEDFFSEFINAGSHVSRAAR
jgi:4,5-dihydroxyphthalate decarboxylase